MLRNVKHAFELDALHGDTKWRDAMQAKLSALHELNVFFPLKRREMPPADYKRGRYFGSSLSNRMGHIRHDALQEATSLDLLKSRMSMPPLSRLPMSDFYFLWWHSTILELLQAISKMLISMQKLKKKYLFKLARNLSIFKD